MSEEDKKRVTESKDFKIPYFLTDECRDNEKIIIDSCDALVRQGASQLQGRFCV